MPQAPFADDLIYKEFVLLFLSFLGSVLRLSWARQTDRNLYAYRTHRILRITSFACNTSPSAVRTTENGRLPYLARRV